MYLYVCAMPIIGNNSSMQKKKYFFIIVERFFECCTEGELKINTKIMLLFEKSKKRKRRIEM